MSAAIDVPPLRHPQLGTPTVVYRYERASGDLAFVVCRFEPKDFRPAQQRDGQWRWSLTGAPVVPYRLPEVNTALNEAATIWIVDGEKDADALAALGVIATCCARSQNWSVDLAEQFIGARRIRIVADRDGGTGERQARGVAQLLVDVGAIASSDIELVQAAAGKDASDHIAAGHSLDDFEFLGDASTPEAQTPVDSWLPRDLNDLPETPPIQPTLGGLGLVYPGKRHVFSGPPESAKTLAAYTVLIQSLRATPGSRCALIDFEMGGYDARARLRELGATPGEIGAVAYVEPEEPPSDESMQRLVALEPILVVIDAAAGAYALAGLDDNKRTDVEKIARFYVTAFWRAGIATIFIDHVVKDTEARGRYAIGSERKLGRADVHLGFETVTAISRGSSGHYKIITHKDRGGWLKRGHVADLKLDSDPVTHSIGWQFLGAAGSDEFRPTHLMEKVSERMQNATEPLSKNGICGLVGGTKEYVLKAVDVLVSEGYLGQIDVARGHPRFSSILTYSEADDPMHSPVDNELLLGSSALVRSGSEAVREPLSGSGSSGSPPYGGRTTSPPASDPPDEGKWFGTAEGLPF